MDKACLKKLINVVDVEQSKKDNIYSKDTVFIYLSATDYKCHKLATDGTIREGSAILIPKFKTNQEYLFNAVNLVIYDFMAKYVGRAINLSINDLKYFELYWHDDFNIQCEIVDKLKVVDESIKQVEVEINKLKDFKTFCLDNMFA